MKKKLSQPILRWLHESGIPVSRNYLDLQLQSHPDYPSLASITDTLDELGIDNISLVVDREKLEELPVPFLTHSSAKGGEFILINDIDKQIRQDQKFEEFWNGIIVLAEKPGDWYHAGNERMLAEEKKRRKLNLLGIAAVVLIAGFSLLNHFSFYLSGLLVVSLAGLAIAILIVQQEIGISNEIAEQLCSIGKQTDCEAVINSKGGGLGKWFNWADVGIIYFFSYVLLLAGSSGNLRPISFVSAMAIPFVFFSLYYQWRVAKKWCVLCLLTVFVLTAQFVLLGTEFANGLTGWSDVLPGLVPVTFTFVITGGAWSLIIKPALQKNKELTDVSHSLRRFKNNPDVFNALLEKQKKMDAAPFENDLQFGNPESSVQMVIACNPYCAPCAKTHEILQELTVKKNIGLTIRFAINSKNVEEKKMQAIAYLLELMEGTTVSKKREIMHDWYSIMEMDKFSEKYPLPEKTGESASIMNNTSSWVMSVMELHEQWTIAARISVTPTLFINGYELPKEYRANDLNWVIKKEEVRGPETTDVSIKSSR